MCEKNFAMFARFFLDGPSLYVYMYIFKRFKTLIKTWDDKNILLQKILSLVNHNIKKLKWFTIFADLYLLAPHTSGLSSERPAGRETDEQMSAGKSAGLAEEGHCVRGQSSWPHAEQRTGNIPGVTQQCRFIPTGTCYVHS